MTAARPRVVLISHELPNDHPGHAGGVYVQHVHRLAAANAHVTAISPNTPSNREAAEQPGSPERTLLPAYPSDTSNVLVRSVDSVMLRLFQLGLRLCVGLPSFTVARALLSRTPERAAIVSADIIDLQYSESIRLAALIRRINPHARIVGTFHDVQSQVVARYPARPGHGWLKWRINCWQLKRGERNAFGRLDDVVVFSDKDAELLPGACRVIKPPLALPRSVERRGDPATPTVLMVGVMGRPENDEGARWLVDHVWPAVVERVPHALLRIVGSGASRELAASVAKQMNVTLAGFVDDLEPEYSSAAAVVVPLHHGAGVKFKTIEALVRAVPVVTTAVGAEGIGDSSRYAGFSDDPRSFADALVRVLRDPAAADEAAVETSAWAVAEFGPEQFRSGTEASYGVRGWRLHEERDR